MTHPYGVEHIQAEAGAVKGINTTEDIGGLVPDGTFDQTLASKAAPVPEVDQPVHPPATSATPRWTTP